jgi:hypothetical protein
MDSVNPREKFLLQTRYKKIQTFLIGLGLARIFHGCFLNYFPLKGPSHQIRFA